MAAIDNQHVLKKERIIMGLGMKMGEGHRGYDRPTHEKNSLTHPSLLPLNGHLKQNCPHTCKRCGLKGCGGVKSKGKICMVYDGIPEGLAKIMPGSWSEKRMMEERQRLHFSIPY